MHMVAFMYPNQAGAKFNFAHFLRVHLTMGVGLLQQHLGIKPQKIVVYSQTRNGAGAMAPYIAISSVFFDTREAAETFVSLFGVEEAARRLKADFPNYTPAPPEVLIAEVTELTDMDGLIRTFVQDEHAASAAHPAPAGERS